jgi:hypothetical protein
MWTFEQKISKKNPIYGISLSDDLISVGDFKIMILKSSFHQIFMISKSKFENLLKKK